MMEKALKPHLLCLLILLTNAVNAVNMECAQIVNDDFYDLGLLNNEDQDYSVEYGDDYNVYFSFCRPTIQQCSESASPGSYAVLKSVSSTECKELTLQDNDYIEYQRSKEVNGIEISFKKRSQNQEFTFKLSLECDPNVSSAVFEPAELVEDSVLLVRGTSPEACPVYKTHFIVQKLRNFKYLYVCLAFVLGLALCFYGLKLFKPTLFIMGFVAGFFSTFMFLLTIWTGNDSNENFRFWSIFTFSLLVGVTCGFFLPSMTRLGLTISGGTLGFVAGIVFYNVFLSWIKSKPASLLFYNTVIVGSVIGSIFGFEYHQDILILATAVLGAEQFVRSIGILIGGYPNEIEIIDRISKGESLGFRWTYLAYGVLIALVAAAGVYNQYKVKKKKDEIIKGAQYLKALITAKSPEERTVELEKD